MKEIIYRTTRPFYLTRSYRKVLEMTFRPLPNLFAIPEYNLIQLEPPEIVKKRGRPSNKTRKASHGEKRKNKCSRCHQEGHTKATCTETPANPYVHNELEGATI